MANVYKEHAEAISKKVKQAILEKKDHIHIRLRSWGDWELWINGKEVDFFDEKHFCPKHKNVELKFEERPDDNPNYRYGICSVCDQTFRFEREDNG